MIFASIGITDHALDRFRERHNADATRLDVRRMLEGAEDAPAWVRKCIGRQARAENVNLEEAELLVAGPEHGEMIFVVRLEDQGWHAHLVTCIPLRYAEDVRRGCGTKLHKRKPSHRFKAS